jgi:hypothetical protein
VLGDLRDGLVLKDAAGYPPLEQGEGRDEAEVPDRAAPEGGAGVGAHLVDDRLDAAGCAAAVAQGEDRVAADELAVAALELGAGLHDELKESNSESASRPRSETIRRWSAANGPGRSSKGAVVTAPSIPGRGSSSPSSSPRRRSHG